MYIYIYHCYVKVKLVDTKDSESLVSSVTKSLVILSYFVVYIMTSYDITPLQVI